MKKFLIALLVLVLLVIGGLLAAPFLIPVDTYKQQIAKQVEQATGRALAIDGPVSLSLLPSVAVEADQVRLANVEGAAESDMVRLEALEVELKVLPLLSGSVEVARFVLIRPEIHLEIDQDGRGNWQLQVPGGETAPADAEPAPAEPGEGGGGLPISELKLGDIRIENGTITLRDATSGVNERIEKVNLTVQLPDLRSRLETAGSLVYKENTVELDLAVDQPLAVIQGERSPLTVGVESEPVAFSFDGVVRSGAQQGAQGALELDVRSIRDLAAWLAQPLDYQAEGLRTLKIAGKLDAAPTMVNFTDAAITLDDVTAEGDFSADMSGPKPRLTGTLEVGEVDLDRYLPPAVENGGGEQVADGGAPADGEGDAASEWSNEPIPIPTLDMVEIDFALGVAGIKVQDLELGRTALELELKDAVLETRLTEFALYGGRGGGTFQLDTGKKKPAITTSFQLEGLQALPFLTAAADFARLEGTVGADLQFETNGRSQRAFVSNLDGQGEVLFADGAIVGINLAQMVRNIGAAFTGGGDGVQKTDFAELGGSFQVKKGVLTNDDLRLQAPVLRLAGGGTVNIRKRTLDYRIEPKAAPTLEGQGGSSEVAGILVPVNITGTFDDPEFQPDLAAVLGSAGATGEAVQKQIKQLEGQKDQLEEAAKSGDVEGLVKGVSGLLGDSTDKQGDKTKKKGGKAQDGRAEKDGAAKAKPEAQSEDPAQQLLKGILRN